jgi:Cu-Zn family superoxide dismutase
MQKHPNGRVLLSLICAFFVGCGGGGAESGETGDTTGGGEATAGGAAVAVAAMQPTEGNEVSGTVRFEQTGEGLAVQVDLTGLPPSSQHGFHVHETGDCSAPDATSAGDHYNPEGHPHALPNGEARHAGDMGNLEADENGEVHTQLVIDTMSIDGERPSVIGRAVIVHANPDDGGQPTGNAGARIACGVVEAG